LRGATGLQRPERLAGRQRGGVGNPGGGRTGPCGVIGGGPEVGPAADESIPGEGETGADADDVQAGGSLPRPRGACSGEPYDGSAGSVPAVGG